MKIGIMGHTFIGWGGGIDFLRMVCASLHGSGEPVELHLLLPVSGPQVFGRRLARGLRCTARKALGRPVSESFAPSLGDIRAAVADTGGEVRIHAIDLGHRALKRAADRLALDVLLPAAEALPSSIDLPWVGYLYDFQHQHLPQFFSERERLARDRAFAQMLDTARVVIVNSRAVAQDAAAFRPQARARIVALPFSAAPTPSWLALDAGAARIRRGLDRPYFIVCNQFWVHKDHRTAIDAFARVAAQNAEVQLVCTGATADYRHPGHLQELLQFAETLGVRDRIHVLGLVPKHEQIALMRGAVALLQPTLFEGGPGGGAVYDAVSLGVSALVSDIAVNREIDEPGVAFFRAGDPTALARLMADALSNPGSPLADDSGILLSLGRERRARCGAAILDGVRYAMALSQA
jgi:glycosyltransferase involved in cell wall biosynthesis